MSDSEGCWVFLIPGDNTKCTQRRQIFSFSWWRGSGKGGLDIAGYVLVFLNDYQMFIFWTSGMLVVEWKQFKRKALPTLLTIQTQGVGEKKQA